MIEKINLRDHLIPVTNITVFQCVGCGFRIALPSHLQIRVRDIRCTNCSSSPGLRLDRHCPTLPRR